MQGNKIDHKYKDQAIDILNRIERLRDDIAYEIVQRYEQQDATFLKKLLYNVNSCINILNKYKGE